jgi:propanol-preferring alcohol dehydrogenase
MFGEDGGDAAQEAARSLGAEVLVGQGDAGLATQFDVVVVVTEASAAETALGLSLAGTLGRVITASCSTDVVALEPESIRKRGLLVRGGRAHTAASLDDAIAAVTAHRNWFPKGFFETFALDQAQGALTTMHDSRNRPYGRHRVIVPGANRSD